MHNSNFEFRIQQMEAEMNDLIKSTQTLTRKNQSLRRDKEFGEEKMKYVIIVCTRGVLEHVMLHTPAILGNWKPSWKLKKVKYLSFSNKLVTEKL